MKRKNLLVIFGTVFIGVVLCFGPVKAQDVQIHGFASQGYMWSDLNNFLVDSEDGSAEFNEAAINFQSRLTDNLRAGIQLYAKDIGNSGNNRVTLDWAYGDYRFEDWLGVRFGRVKKPKGLYGEIRDYDMLRVPILLPQGWYHDQFRELTGFMNGMNIYGSISVGDIGSFDYLLYAGENSLSEGSALYDVLGDVMDIKSMDQDGMWGAQAEFNTNFGLRLYTLYTVYQFELEAEMDILMGPPPALRFEVLNKIQNAINRFYAFEYTYEKLTLTGEYMNTDAVERKWMEQIAGPMSMYDRDNNRKEAWYAMVSYQITDQLAASVYYHEQYEDRDDRDGKDYEDETPSTDDPVKLDYEMWHKEWVASVRYDVNDYWLFKLEGHSIDGMSLSNPGEDGVYSQHWSLFAVKTTFTF